MSKKRRSDEEAILIAVCELVKGATLLKAGRSVKINLEFICFKFSGLCF